MNLLSELNSFAKTIQGKTNSQACVPEIHGHVTSVRCVHSRAVKLVGDKLWWSTSNLFNSPSVLMWRQNTAAISGHYKRLNILFLTGAGP